MNNLYVQDCAQLFFLTENQWKCGWIPVEMLPIHLVIQDIFFPHTFWSLISAQNFFFFFLPRVSATIKCYIGAKYKILSIVLLVLNLSD